MNPKIRVVAIVVLVALLAGLAFVVFSKISHPTGSRELKTLVDGFMNTLPEKTSAEQREEIQGIMNRFYEKAKNGDLYAEDVVEIGNDLRAYIQKGRIPEEELFGFMSKVGKATRRVPGGAGAQKD